MHATWPTSFTTKVSVPHPSGKGKIVTTPNAETPLTTGAKPLITCDVWEHAYYIDYRNKRDGFLEAFCDKLLNWDFAAKNLKG